MTQYICPGCDKKMIVAKYYNGTDTPPDYECINCDLYYLTPYEEVKGNLGHTKDPTTIVTGDFDYCCRVYKLKAFS